MNTTLAPTPADLAVGPLAKYVTVPEAPPADLAADALPCEIGIPTLSCTDLRPILVEAAFHLSVPRPGRLHKLLRNRLPQFGIFRPNDKRALCYFLPATGAIAFGGRGAGNEKGFDTKLRNRIPNYEFFAAVSILGVAFLNVVLMAIFWQHPISVAFLGGALLCGVPGAVVLGKTDRRPFRDLEWVYGTAHKELVAQYTGPIPAEIRTRVRALKNPYIVAAVESWQDSPERRPTIDPYLVELCSEKHLHVDAWWDVSREEVVLSEFVVPSPAKKKAEEGALDGTIRSFDFARDYVAWPNPRPRMIEYRLSNGMTIRQPIGDPTPSEHIVSAREVE